MTIADKLNYLNDTKQAIKQAITDKGVEVLETDTFRSYANKIASIESGGGSGADYKSSLMATTTQSAYSPSFVSLSNYVLPDYTIEKGQTGLLYPKGTTEKANFTIVGAAYPENKVVQSFSSTDYITFSKPDFSTFNSWEIVLKFKMNTLNRYQFWLYYPVAFGLDSSNRLHIWRTPSEMISTYTFSTGVDYWVKLEYTGERYIAFYKTTKAGEWIQLVTLDDPTKVSTDGYTSYIGINPNVTSEYLYGSVDLAECYVKGDDSFFWTPYETTDEYDSSNVKKIGTSISVSDSNFVSGFDFNNYLKFTHNLTEPIRNLDLIIKGRVSTANSYQVGIAFRGTSVAWAHWLKIYNSNKVGMLTIGDTDSGGFTVLNEVDYWFRCVGAENTFTLYCKRYDGLSIEETKNQEDWTQVFQTSLDKCIGQGVNTFEIGRNFDQSYSTQYWRGGFDLKNFQFIINDEIVCVYNRRLRGICTKDFMPQAGINTLNAYHIEYTDGTSECLLGQTEPTGEDIKSVQLLESGLTFEEDKAWTYNEDREQFE